MSASEYQHPTHSFARARLSDGEGRSGLQATRELLVLPCNGEQFGLYRRYRLSLGQAAQLSASLW